MPVSVLTSPKHVDLVKSVLPNAAVAHDLAGIPAGTDCLIAFQTGVIVPERLLLVTDIAVNFHGAPPAYPGRDPHHWAAYDRAEEYGATAHFMWPEVDAGPIIGTLLFGMAPSNDPAAYRKRGEDAAAMLFRSMAPSVAERGAPCLPVKWSGTKRARRDLIAMCDFKGLAPSEVERRRKVFAGFEPLFSF